MNHMDYKSSGTMVSNVSCTTSCLAASFMKSSASLKAL